MRSPEVRRGSVTVLALLAGLLAGCMPSITGLQPTSGPPRTLVNLAGSGLLFSTVRWDRGLAGEAAVPTSLGGTFFNVPTTATAGPHPLASTVGSNVSNVVSFTVEGAMPAWPAPRINDVTVNLARFGSDGKVSVWLMVHGTNFDVGATIAIGGIDQPTLFARGLDANLVIDPSTLAYPIFYYSTVWCPLDGLAPGSTLAITVRNRDGQISAPRSYTVAASEAQLDSDGDGLLDTWESAGYDANGDGTIDVDLPAMGADPLHKDVFVEADWMAGAVPPTAVFTNGAAAMATLPVLNSDGTQGIVLHVDYGQGAPFTGGGNVLGNTTCIGFDASGTGQIDFYSVKSANFDARRLRVFHYAVFGIDDAVCSTTCTTGVSSQCGSGRSDGFFTNDFYVTCTWCANSNALMGTFLHELGHNLNLLHGGNVDVNRKPNYPSIMRYGYQFPGVSTTCDLTPDGVYTYSQGMYASLDENNLNEALGICGHVPIDWNGTGGSVQTGVSAEINQDTLKQVLEDHNDIGRIRLDFTAGTDWGND